MIVSGHWDHFREAMYPVMERDGEARKAMYEEIQKAHRETSPFIVMFQQARQTGVRANVKGFYTGGAVDAAAYWLATK